MEHLHHLKLLSAQTVHEFIVNKTPESLILEYKECLPGRRDDDKREFLFDVSAFMNAIGGKIVFGLSAKDGIPTGISGLEVEHKEPEIGRLSRLLEDCIVPRAQFQFCWVDMGADGVVLELNIPPSPEAPHQVKHSNHQWFYVRDGIGKHKMSIDELRAKFRAVNPALSLHKEEYIKLPHLFLPKDPYVRKVKFENCVLDGPMNIMFFGDFTLKGSGLTDTQIIIVDNNEKILNTLAFESCEFQDCFFNSTTWFMSQGMYTQVGPYLPPTHVIRPKP